MRSWIWKSTVNSVFSQIKRLRNLSSQINGKRKEEKISYFPLSRWNWNWGFFGSESRWQVTKEINVLVRFCKKISTCGLGWKLLSFLCVFASSFDHQSILWGSLQRNPAFYSELPKFNEMQYSTAHLQFRYDIHILDLVKVSYKNHMRKRTRIGLKFYDEQFWSVQEKKT